jgi:hypothetical protein
MANLAELGPLRVRQPRASLQLGLQNPIFSNKILVAYPMKNYDGRKYSTLEATGTHLGLVF